MSNKINSPRTQEILSTLQKIIDSMIGNPTNLKEPLEKWLNELHGDDLSKYCLCTPVVEMIHKAKPEPSFQDCQAYIDFAISKSFFKQNYDGPCKKLNDLLLNAYKNPTATFIAAGMDMPYRQIKATYKTEIISFALGKYWEKTRYAYELDKQLFNEMLTTPHIKIALDTIKKVHEHCDCFYVSTQHATRIGYTDLTDVLGYFVYIDFLNDSEMPNIVGKAIRRNEFDFDTYGESLSSQELLEYRKDKQKKNGWLECDTDFDDPNELIRFNPLAFTLLTIQHIAKTGIYPTKPDDIPLLTPISATSQTAKQTESQSIKKTQQEKAPRSIKPKTVIHKIPTTKTNIQNPMPVKILRKGNGHENRD